MNERFAPRCPSCGASLAEHARYRSIRVSPADERTGGPTLPLPLVYCGRCGTAIAALGSTLPRSTLLGLPSPAPTPPPAIAPSPVRVGYGTRRPPPLRHFPGTVETIGLSELPAGAKVQLVYQDRRLLEGTIGTTEVSLHLVVLQSRASARGLVGGASLTIAWDFIRTSPESPDIAATVEGVFADQPVDLRATFHFQPATWLHHGDVVGNLAGSPLRAHVEPADGGFDSPATVAIDGVLGMGTFSAFASVAADRTRGAVRGSVDGRPLVLDTGQVMGIRGSTLRVTGAFEGPPAVLLLAIGTLLHCQ
jgi:hypothetical protein